MLLVIFALFAVFKETLKKEEEALIQSLVNTMTLLAYVQKIS